MAFHILKSIRCTYRIFIFLHYITSHSKSYWMTVKKAQHSWYTSIFSNDSRENSLYFSIPESELLASYTLSCIPPSATRRIYIVSPMNFEVSRRKWPFWNSYLMYEVPPRRTGRVSCLYCPRRWVMGFSLSAEKRAKGVEWRDTYFSLIKNLNLNCWHIYDSYAPGLPSDLFKFTEWFKAVLSGKLLE